MSQTPLTDAYLEHHESRLQESWWLIENNELASVAHYFTGSGWTREAWKAARFSTEHDADQVRVMMAARHDPDSREREELLEAKAVSHGFIYHMPM